MIAVSRRFAAVCPRAPVVVGKRDDAADLITRWWSSVELAIRRSASHRWPIGFDQEQVAALILAVSSTRVNMGDKFAMRNLMVDLV